MSSSDVFFFIPNLIGYARLCLLGIAWRYIDDCPEMFLAFYVPSVILDGFDGYSARLLNQTSAFGAWLDVVVDNIGRAMLWSHIYKWGCLISSFEWLVFVCTHSLGKSWKSSAPNPQPLWVQAVMAEGFKTPIGAFAIAGLHILPIWLYGQKMMLWHPNLRPCLQFLTTLMLGTGRVLCLCVELWFVLAHIKDLAALTPPPEPVRRRHRSPSPRQQSSQQPRQPVMVRTREPSPTRRSMTPQRPDTVKTRKPSPTRRPSTPRQDTMRTRQPSPTRKPMPPKQQRRQDAAGTRQPSPTRKSVLGQSPQTQTKTQARTSPVARSEGPREPGTQQAQRRSPRSEAPAKSAQGSPAQRQRGRTPSPGRKKLQGPDGDGREQERSPQRPTGGGRERQSRDQQRRRSQTP